MISKTINYINAIKQLNSLGDLGGGALPIKGEEGDCIRITFSFEPTTSNI